MVGEAVPFGGTNPNHSGFYSDIFRLQNKTKIVAESSHSEQQLGFMRRFAYLCPTQKPFGRYKGSILPASDA